MFSPLLDSTIIVATVFILGYIVLKVKKRLRVQELIDNIEEQYEVLNAIVASSYELKKCPKCFESRMSIQDISPTGQSIKYSCDYCNNIITSKLIHGKKGIYSVKKNDYIQELIVTLSETTDREDIWENIDISFNIDESIIHTPKKQLRTPISESVRHEVWRRDEGKCVICGSQAKLEFDHIIPHSKGGADTVRNLQLLCESCNRSKSAKI